MNRKVTILPILGGLVAVMLLSACGPSQTDLDATATNVAADIFAAQTADAPEATPTYTITPIPTSTLTATPVPSHTPTATHTPQPDQNMMLEVKGMYLQEFISNDWCGSPGMRMGEITLDTLGNIWIAGGCQGLDGLHVFDGIEWTSHDGSYMDLAHDLEGQIWAISPFSGAVDFYDGQQWRTIEGKDLGLGGQQILQIEVDSNGRIWIIADDFGVEQVAEIVLQDGQPTAVFSHPEFTITGGQINSLDADNQGRLWASVWSYTNSDIEIKSAGLNVFDGGTWQLVTDQNVDLQNVVRTTCDDQGTVWVATQCGSVMTYDGTTWTTVVEGDTDPGCDFGDQAIGGITLDPQGRLWTWNFYGIIRLLEDGAWIDFTLENSGLTDIIIFGLAVDELDQVWIGTTEGVVMATLQ